MFLIPQGSLQYKQGQNIKDGSMDNCLQEQSQRKLPERYNLRHIIVLKLRPGVAIEA